MTKPSIGLAKRGTEATSAWDTPRTCNVSPQIADAPNLKRKGLPPSFTKVIIYLAV